MKAIIIVNTKARRVKVKIPYKAIHWRKCIKKIHNFCYHPEQKLWSVPNTQANIDRLKEIFGEYYSIEEKKESKRSLPKISLNDKSISELLKIKENLSLKDIVITPSDIIQILYHTFLNFLNRGIYPVLVKRILNLMWQL